MVIVFGLAAAVLAWLAIFGDKPRGKARCPKCWYELGRLDAPPALPVTCPECGTKVQALGQLTRRRFGPWTMLAACFIAGVAWLGWKLPEVDERGWLWLVPDRIVFELLPITGARGPLGDELQRRLGKSPWPSATIERTLTADDVAALLRRAARGNVFARPITNAWRQSFGDALRDVHGVLTENDGRVSFEAGFRPVAPDDGGEELAEAMREVDRIPADVVLATPARWPRAETTPLCVRLDIEGWWPHWYHVDGAVEFVARNERGESVQGSAAMENKELLLTIPLDGVVDVSGRVSLWRSVYDRVSPRTHDLYSHPFTFRYEVVASVDDVIPPLVDPRLDQAMQGLVLSTSAVHPMLDASALENMGFDDVAFGADVVIRSSGVEFAVGRVRWHGAAKLADIRIERVHTLAPEFGKVERGITPPGMTITLTSNPSEAIYVVGAKRYWSGEVTFPLTPGGRGSDIPYPR